MGLRKGVVFLVWLGEFHFAPSAISTKLLDSLKTFSFT